jgi:hypothetical protein
MYETTAAFATMALSGYELLAPLFNKGTAFSETEREAFDLHGLLPPNVTTLDEQVSRRLQALRGFETDLERYAFLRELQDTNETLFYALLVENMEELMPIVYTPTVGAGCQHFSRLFRKPRGLFLSIPHKDRIDRIFAQPRFDTVEAIVVTDGERILGLGTRAPAAWASRSASSRFIRAAAACIPRRPYRSCSMSEPTIPTAWPIRSTSAGATSAFADRTMTTSSKPLSRPW